MYPIISKGSQHSTHNLTFDEHIKENPLKFQHKSSGFFLSSLYTSNAESTAMKKTARKHDYSSLTITEALSQLLDAAEMIELRQSVKPHEEKRITGAFHLINQPEYDPKTKSDQRRENFKHLLKKLRADCGPELVISCALGLGQTAFANMREVYRLRLPTEVTKRKEKFKSPYIQGLAKSYCCKGKQCTFTDTLRLTPVEFQLAQLLRIMSNQHKGFIWPSLQITSNHKKTLLYCQHQVLQI